MLGRKKNSRGGPSVRRKQREGKFPGVFVSKPPPRPFKTELPVRFVKPTLGQDPVIGPQLERLKIRLQIQENKEKR